MLFCLVSFIMEGSPNHEMPQPAMDLAKDILFRPTRTPKKKHTSTAQAYPQTPMDIVTLHTTTIAALRLQKNSGCTCLLGVEIVGLLFYITQASLVIADLVYNIRQESTISSLTPQLFVSFAGASWGYAVVWHVVFFCTYVNRVKQKRADDDRHYLPIQRFARVYLVYSSLVFLLYVLFFIDFQTEDTGQFAHRYQSECRAPPNPTTPFNQCPSAQLISFWFCIHAVVLSYAAVHALVFHDSYAYHRFPQVVKKFPAHPICRV